MRLFTFVLGAAVAWLITRLLQRGVSWASMQSLTSLVSSLWSGAGAKKGLGSGSTQPDFPTSGVTIPSNNG